ncbi:MAG: chemotaxis protein CheW [Polyangiaceae bacterium]|nr:chemotaxis protein CheW [Polyangiaceae bacterium]
MSDAHAQEHLSRVLDERALRLARIPAEEKRRTLLYPAAILVVGKTLVGIAVNALREVQTAAPITPLPGLPEGMLGVAHVRGEVICVVDLSRWIGTEERGTGACLAVIEGPRGPLGLVADHCAGFRDVYEEDVVRDFAAASKVRLRHVRAMTRDLVAILDVPELLADPRLIVGAPAPRTPEGLS